MTSSDKSAIWSSLSGYGYTGSRQPGDKIRVLIVDDHAGYRRGLRGILELDVDFETVGEAENGHEALEMVGQLKPDVVLMDMNMPGADGLEVTRRLIADYPNLCVIILTMFPGEDYLREARRAGASAYVLKDAGSDVLLDTIKAVVAGEVPILQADEPIGTGPLHPHMLDEAAHNADLAQLLTANERALLAHLALGDTNTEIAHKMSLSDEMVGTYLAEIYRKLHLPGRDAAMQLARQLFYSGD